VVFKEEKNLVFSKAMEHGGSFFHIDQHVKSSSGKFSTHQQNFLSQII